MRLIGIPQHPSTKTMSPQDQERRRREEAIKSEVDYLSRNFFVGPGNDQVFKKWGEIAMELALDWQKNPEKKKIHADVTLPDLAKIFEETDIPKKGERIEDVFAECKAKILENSVRINNPRYIGHMTTVVPWFSVVLDILITSINQNQVKIETALASSFVERQTLAWMHRLIYSKPATYYKQVIQDNNVALGNTTSGGTLGNLTALAVAREKFLPGVRQKGLYKVFKDSGYTDVAILASKRVHYSIKKTASLLGLGEEAVIELPVDGNNKIDLAALEQAIASLKRKRVLILAMVGIAGTTETGNIDPLEAMAAIAEREKIWFHVDAAWGGAFLLSEELRPKLKGIEKADSVVLDGHKLFYLTMAHGMVLFKDDSSLDQIRHNANYIIRKGSVDIGQTSLEGSRRFNALKLWFSLKMLGTDGYSVLFKKALHLTDLMTSLIDRHPDFERTSNPEVCILTYRFAPQRYIKALQEAKEQDNLPRMLQINNLLNEVNVELQKKQRERGQSFTSRTTLESTGYFQGIVVQRAVLTNLMTKSSYLAEILEEQRQLGEEVLVELDPGSRLLGT